MTWEAAQDQRVARLKKSLRREPTLREIARDVLLPGSFLIQGTYSDGTIRRYIHSVKDEWDRGVKSDLEQMFRRDATSDGGLQTWGRLTKVVRRTSLQVLDHNGSNISFADLDKYVKRDDLVISFKKILRSWGIHDKTDWEENRLVIENLISDEREIRLKRAPNEDGFLRLMYDWEQRGIPTTIHRLYHGCYSHSIPSILLNGLEVRDNRGGGNASGPGIYLGQTDKAANYAQPGERVGGKKWWRSKTTDARVIPFRFLLECDVLLGKIWHPGKCLFAQARKGMEEAGCQSLSLMFARQEWTVYNPNQVVIRKIIRLGA